jgi:hypothetical protein
VTLAVRHSAIQLICARPTGLQINRLIRECMASEFWQKSGKLSNFLRSLVAP